MRLSGFSVICFLAFSFGEALANTRLVTVEGTQAEAVAQGIATLRLPLNSDATEDAITKVLSSSEEWLLAVKAKDLSCWKGTGTAVCRAASIGGDRSAPAVDSLFRALDSLRLFGAFTDSQGTRRVGAGFVTCTVFPLATASGTTPARASCAIAVREPI